MLPLASTAGAPTIQFGLLHAVLLTNVVIAFVEGFIYPMNIFGEPDIYAHPESHILPDVSTARLCVTKYPELDPEGRGL
jgi:hypothetical protein